MTDFGAPEGQSPSDRLLWHLGGKQRSQALSTAAAIGVADRLAAVGKTDFRILAADLGCDADSLHSLLQLLAGLGYLAEPDPDVFELTTSGRTLCRDALGPLAAFVGSAEQWDPWARLRIAIRDRSGGGRTAFEHATGLGLYDYLAQDVAAARRYDDAIEAFTRYEAETLFRSLDLTTASRVVDVGAGRGGLLFELLSRWPNLDGVLFDLPHVVGDVRLEARPELAGRIEAVGGDFFEGVPPGGDVYLLKHVLHNWDDDRAIGLLARCAEAMTDSGRVVVIDSVLAPDGRPDLARMLDLEMRVLTGGRERRKPELRRLFAAAGLNVERFDRLTATSWLLVGRPRRASA